MDSRNVVLSTPGRNPFNIKVLMDYSYSRDYRFDYTSVVNTYRHYNRQIIREGEWVGFLLNADEFVRGIVNGHKPTTRKKNAETQTEDVYMEETFWEDEAGPANAQANAQADAWLAETPQRADVNNRSPDLFSSPL